MGACGGGSGEKAGKQIKRARGVSVFASPGRHKSSDNNSDAAVQGPGDNAAALGMGPTAEGWGRGSRGAERQGGKSYHLPGSPSL